MGPCGNHRDIDALPFCHRTLHASKRPHFADPTILTTIGDHIRTRRLDLGLQQKELARKLYVDEMTIVNWELHGTVPTLKSWPRVLELLGYDPRPIPQSIGGALRRFREGLGLSATEAAGKLGVCPDCVRGWERLPDERHNHLSLPQIITFMGSNPMSPPDSVSEYIRQVRYVAGFNQKQMAARLAVTVNNVSDWERGRAIPDAARLRTIAQVNDELPVTHAVRRI